LNVNKLRTRSCIIDGKAAATMAQLRRIRYRRHDASVFLYAFDLIELNGDDLRRDPLEVRKATLASSWPRPVLACGWMSTLSMKTARWVFRHACKLGLEGIVSKRKGSPYRSGRSPD
jgi:bifunctional non-homologous end joining protein LigD